MCKLFGFAINEVNVCIIEFVGGVLKDIYNIGTLCLLIIARQHVGCWECDLQAPNVANFEVAQLVVI